MLVGYTLNPTATASPPATAPATIVVGSAAAKNVLAAGAHVPRHGSALTLRAPRSAETTLPDRGNLSKALIERTQGLNRTLAAADTYETRLRAAHQIEQRQARALAAATTIPMGLTGLQALAFAAMTAEGWGAGQWTPLDLLITRESGWNPLAKNPKSGAYGLPQSLPGIKMASVGPDWRTNPETQLRWMMGYIRDRYGDPKGAWAHSQAVGWY